MSRARKADQVAMRLAVRPGAVHKLLQVTEWLDFHICMYLSVFDEVVICDDDKLLQILPLRAGSADVELNSGCLCITVADKLLLYQPLVKYGSSVQWKLIYETKITNDEIFEAQWLNDRMLLVASAAQLIIYDMMDRYIVSSIDLDVEHIEVSHLSSGEVLAWSCKSSKIVLFNNIGATHTDFDVIDVGSYIPKKCYFVHEGVIVVETTNDGPTFLYSHIHLLLTTTQSCIAYQKANSEKNMINVEVPGDAVYSVNFGGVDTNISKIGDTSALPVGTSVVKVNDSRVYFCDNRAQSLDIYAIDGGKVGSLSGLHSRNTTCIALSHTLTLLGSNLVDKDFNFLSSIDRFNPVFACFEHGDGDEATLVIMNAENQLVWLNREFSDISRTVQLKEPNPISLQSAGKNIIYVVFSHAVQVYENGSLISTLEQTSLIGANIGTDVNERPFIVTYTSTRVQAGEISLDLQANLVSSSLSPRSRWLLAAYKDSFELLSTTDPGFRGPKISIAGIRAGEWNHDGSLVAILTEECVLIYKVVSILRGSFELYDKIMKPFKFFGHQVTLKWDITGRLILFDGMHVWYTEILRFLPVEKQESLPVYHPRYLCLLAQALKPHLVELICLKLTTELKFSTLNGNGYFELDPMLKLHSLAALDRAGNSKIQGVLDSSTVLSYLNKAEGIVGLSSQDFRLLKSFIESTAELGQLDALAFCSFVLYRVFGMLHQSWTYAYYSTTKLELQQLLSSDKWHVWLDIEPLKAEVEQQAKIEFAQNRDPTAVTLYYLALHKLSVVQTLWRIAGGHAEREKTIKLLKNDFDTERWRSAAFKNAYALLSKHRDLYAAAFFLLGNSPEDCCQLCVSKLGDISLSLVIARTYGRKFKETIKDLQQRFEQQGLLWLSVFCAILLGRELTQLNGSIDPTAIMMGLLFGNTPQVDATAVLTSSGLNEQLVQVLLNIEPIVRTIDPHLDVSEEPSEEHAESAPLLNEGAEINDKKDISREDPGVHDQTDALNDLENRSVPANLKPAPVDIQLEPDMSAFGF